MCYNCLTSNTENWYTGALKNSLDTEGIQENASHLF